MNAYQYNEFLKARVKEAKDSVEANILNMVRGNSSEKDLLSRLGGSSFSLDNLYTNLDALLGNFNSAIEKTGVPVSIEPSADDVY